MKAAELAPKVGSRIFLRFDLPRTGRVLEPGNVNEVARGRWTTVFEARHHTVEAGEEKLLYYNRGREFLDQTVRVESQSSDGPPFDLVVKPIGDSVSVGTRLETRVKVIDCGLEATLDGEPNCPIQDVSLSGIGVISSLSHPVGRSLKIAIRYGEVELAGEMELRVVTALADGRAKCGLRGIFNTAEGRALRNGLTKMTLEIQQRRLQRITASSCGHG